MWFPFSSTAAGDAPIITTVRDLVRDALMELGALGEKQPLTPEKGQQGLRYLKAMVRVLQGDRLHLYTVKRNTFPLMANQQSYTIGPSADFDTDRPLHGLTYAGIVPENDTLEQPIAVLSRIEWDREGLKSLTDLWPRAVRCEPDATGWATLTFWPIPTSAPTFVVEGPVAIVTPENLDTQLIFPGGGYEEAWRVNLAKRLARPSGLPVTNDLNEDARVSLAAIRRINDEGPPTQTGEFSVGPNYDIRSNSHR